MRILALNPGRTGNAATGAFQIGWWLNAASERGKMTNNTWLQESQATGYWNDVPVINYDFQAAIGAYGQLRGHYHSLRGLHLFLEDFGSHLAPMPLVMPETLPASLDDRQTLRWAVRTDGQSDFIFISISRLNPSLISAFQMRC